MTKTLEKRDNIKNLVFDLEDVIPKRFTFQSSTDFVYATDLFQNLLLQRISAFRMEGLYLNQDAFILFFITESNHSAFYQSILEGTNPINKVKPDQFELYKADKKEALKFRDFLKKNVFESFSFHELPSGFTMNVFVIINAKQDKKKKSKYGSKKVYIDYHLFDSRDEANYFFHLLDLQEKGLIKGYTLQPRFLLQEGFVKNDEEFSKIDYKADFEVYHCDNTTEVIDIKGLMTTDFIIKHKMFEYRYMDKSLTLLTYKVSYGGWITLQEYEIQKKERQKAKEEGRKLKNEEKKVKKQPKRKSKKSFKKR